MKYTCGLVEQPAHLTLSVRTRSSVEELPRVLGDIYKSITGYLTELGEDPPRAPFAAYYNMDMQDLDVEAGVLVQEELPGKGDIKPGKIPAGKYAVCMHVGPYNKIEPAYEALMEWVKEKGLNPTGVAYEFYFNSPADTPEDQLKTRIMFPLA
jgi:effector-binding domain-containing protein